MNRKSLITLLSCAAAFGEAAAQDSRVNVTMSAVSYHINDRTFSTGGKTYPYNERNFGWAAEYRLGKYFHVAGGVYENSLHRMSTSIVAGVETDRRRFFGTGLELGGVTGYFEPVVPCAFPYIRIGRSSHMLNLRVITIPKFKDYTPAIIAAQVRLNLGPTFKKKPDSFQKTIHAKKFPQKMKHRIGK